MFLRLNSITSDYRSTLNGITLLTTIYNISSLSLDVFDSVQNSWSKSVTFFWNLCSNGWLFSWWPFALVISRLTLVITESITGPDIIHFNSAFALCRIPTTRSSDLISLLFCSCTWSSDIHEDDRLVLLTVKNPFWNSSKTVGWTRSNFLSDFE